MGNRGRPKQPLELSAEERATLTRWAHRAKSTQALATPSKKGVKRSKSVLDAAQMLTNVAVAAQCGVYRGQVAQALLEHRLDGLVDQPRPGHPATITAEQMEDVVVTTLEKTPKDATHWSRAKIARRTGLSKSTIGRIWKALDLKPHREYGSKLSNDPLFVEKVYDIVGVYLDPPESPVVLSVDEKSHVQALSRSQPAFPIMPGMPEKRTHDYLRHSTISLFAALNVADGTVISSIHRRHRAVEFKRFLTKIDKEVPDELRCMSLAITTGHINTPASKPGWHNTPRFHMHYTPTYSSWINQVERLLPKSPATCCSVRIIAVSKNSKPISANGSNLGTRSPTPSSGPKPPKTSSHPSDAF